MEVTKSFKMILSYNHNRKGPSSVSSVTLRNSHKKADRTNESTKYGGSKDGKAEIDVEGQTVISEIESKYTKKKQKKSIYKKMFVEDDEDSFTREDNANIAPILKNEKKEDLRQLGEFITTKRPKDPFKDLDPLTQKVDINKGLGYKGTS
jgi:hypothetical protein